MCEFVAFSDKKLNQYRIIDFWFGGLYVWIEKKCMKSSQTYMYKKKKSFSYNSMSSDERLFFKVCYYE